RPCTPGQYAEPQLWTVPEICWGSSRWTISYRRSRVSSRSWRHSSAPRRATSVRTSHSMTTFANAKGAVMKIRIVVADQSEAAFYELEQRDMPPQFIQRLTDPQAHLHDRDFKS